MDSKYKKGETVSRFHTVKLWNDLALRAVKILKKGSQVVIHGELDYDEYPHSKYEDVKVRRGYITVRDFDPIFTSTKKETGATVAA